MANFDELRRQIEQDELEDQVDAVLKGEVEEVHLRKMTPIDFARSRKMLPQLVYYYIKRGRLKQEKCVCGRWVIDIKTATELFDNIEANKKAKRSGVDL